MLVETAGPLTSSPTAGARRPRDAYGAHTRGARRRVPGPRSLEILVAGRDRRRTWSLSVAESASATTVRPPSSTTGRTGEHRPSLKQDVADAARMVDHLATSICSSPGHRRRLPRRTAVHQYAAAGRQHHEAGARARQRRVRDRGHHRHDAAVVGGRDELRARRSSTLLQPRVGAATDERVHRLPAGHGAAGLPMLRWRCPWPAPPAGDLGWDAVVCAALQVASLVLASAEPARRLWAASAAARWTCGPALMTSARRDGLLAAGGAALARRTTSPVRSRRCVGLETQRRSVSIRRPRGLALPWRWHRNPRLRRSRRGTTSIGRAGHRTTNLSGDQAGLGGIEVSAATVLVDDICAVGPAGDYLQCGSTMQHLRLLSDPRLLDRRPRSCARRSSDLAERGRAHATRILEEHEPNPAGRRRPADRHILIGMERSMHAGT